MDEPESLLSPDRMSEVQFLQLLSRLLEVETEYTVRVRTLHLDIVLPIEERS